MTFYMKIEKRKNWVTNVPRSEKNIEKKKKKIENMEIHWKDSHWNSRHALP